MFLFVSVTSTYSHYTATKQLDYSYTRNEGLLLEEDYRGEMYAMVDLCCSMSGEEYCFKVEVRTGS